ncbi:MAG: F0F1 ATP synthase subunit delta, partial [Paracoccaceae bacterium]
MSEPTSISSGIAARYATAIFDLAKDESGLATLEKNVAE